MRRVFFWVALCVMAVSPVLADDCSPATCVPPTATPEFSVMWTEPAYTNAQGTPVPARDVVFVYQINAGDVAIIIVGAALFFLVASMSIIIGLRQRGNL